MRPSSYRCGRCNASSAIPIARVDERLRVAIADPANIHGDRRATTRHAVSGRPGRREPRRHPRRARTPRPPDARSWRPSPALDDFEVIDEDEDDLEVDDGVSDAPLVRLVNSVIMQAATDGASDIHFEPQDDALLVRVRVDGVLTEVQRIPKRMANGVTTRLKVLAKLDIAERRQATGRPDLARRAGRGPACSTSASRCCRRSRASRSSCA